MARVQSLNSPEAWRQVREAGGRALVFKHSTTCPISAAARERFTAWVESLGPEEFPIYEVLVIEDRPLSQTIAADTGVEHQSPQAILLEDGKPRWHASHWAITQASLDRAKAGPAARASHSPSLAQAQAEHKRELAALEAGS